MNDKSLKVIYNSSAYEKEADEKNRAFLHFIHTNEPGEDGFSKRLSELVSKIKENEKFRSDYTALNLHEQDIIRMAKREGREEGLSQGAQQKVVEAAKAFLADGKYSPDRIAELLNIPVEDFLEKEPTTDFAAH